MVRDAVLVTGISGNLGRGLARLLHKTDRVVGVDRRPFPGAPKDLEVHNLDIRKRKAEDLFRRGDIQAMIHMAIVHDPRLPQDDQHSFNVVGTKAVLEYAAKYGVRKVVVLSSATVYGPQRRSPPRGPGGRRGRPRRPTAPVVGARPRACVGDWCRPRDTRATIFS